MSRAAVVFAAAPLSPSPRLQARLAQLDAPYVVAADGGATTALAFGYQPDLVIGDLDSIEPRTLAELERRKVPIVVYPRDKDATDGELALGRALEIHPAELWLLGFLGGPRLDQAVGNLLMLTRVTTPACLLDAHNACTLLRPQTPHAWQPEPREIISLVPLTDVGGVRTTGLRWPLEGAPMRLGETRGVSNEPVAADVSVSIETGLLLVTRHFPD